MQSLTISAPAKVNLFLGVGGALPDGYHEVQTILHTLELADTVTLTPADRLSLSCDTDLGIPPEKNLAFRAARQFSATYGLDVLLDIQLTKRIPSGAGLGGGSSDAAAVLVGIAHWAGLPLDEPRLLHIAASLGADVPFLVAGGAALMDRRGDRLVRHLPGLEAPVVLVRVSEPVPTAAAYAAFDAASVAPGDAEATAAALESGDAAAVAGALSNNLIAASTSLVPGIAETLEFLRADAGTLGATMAGSGSATFAICATLGDAKRLAEEARTRGWWAEATRLSAQGPTVNEVEVAL